MKVIVNKELTIDELVSTSMDILCLMPPLNKLNNSEKKVVAELWKSYYKYRGLDVKSRDRLVFDYDSKMEICTKLNISEAFLNNIFCELRKKGIMVGKTLKIVPPIEEDNQIHFNFTLKKDVGTNL